MVKCLECGKEFKDDFGVHRHVKQHKLNTASYYAKHFPRFDKFNGKPIIFEDRDQYFEVHFNSPKNMKDWLLSSSEEDAKAYIREVLTARKNKKNLIYSLTQVELRSLHLPGMVYLDKLFGSYYKECEALGFKNRFPYTRFNGAWKEFNEKHKIIVDTREQLPLTFDGINTIHSKLEFGDYKLNDDIFSHNCVVERKSLSDFYSTLGNDKQLVRFEKELIRAQEAKFNLIILVEEPLSKLPDLAKNLKSIDIRLKGLTYVTFNMRRILQKFLNAQFLFVDNTEEASEVIIKLFKSDGQYKDIDLQYAYDSGNLI